MRPDAQSAFFDNLELEIRRLRERNKEWERQFSIVMGFQNAGMLSESNKDLDSAIKNYWKAIRAGKQLSMMQPNNYLHSIERLCVLYRKRKDYNSEIKCINLAIEEADSSNIFKKEIIIEKYCQRLNRAKELLQKHQMSNH